MKLQKIYFLVYMLLLFSLNLESKNLYVDISTGNDNTSYDQNSEASPWRTLGRAMWGSTSRTNPNAEQAAKAGDSVIVMPGTYTAMEGTDDRNQPIYRPINNGTQYNFIVFKAKYPAIIAQPYQRTIIASNTNGSGEGVLGANGINEYIIFDGFYLDEININTRNDDAPIQIKSCNNIIVKRCVVKCVDAELVWGWSYSANHSAIRVENARDCIIENNMLYDFGGRHHNVSGILFYTSHSIIIRNNEIFNGHTLIHLKGDLGEPRSQGNFNIYLNFLHDGNRGIEIGEVYSINGNTSIHRNLISGCSFAGIGSRSYDSISPSNIDIVNNVILSCGENSYGAFYLRPGEGHSDWVFRNNIIINNYLGCDAESRSDMLPFDFDYNCFYGNQQQVRLNYNNYDWIYWINNLGFGAHSTQLNPLFVDVEQNDFRLSDDSPVLNGGLDILDLNNNGLENDSIPMGIYVTGNETLGLIKTDSNTTGPLPPQNLKIRD